MLAGQKQDHAERNGHGREPDEETQPDARDEEHEQREQHDEQRRREVVLQVDQRGEHARHDERRHNAVHRVVETVLLAVEHMREVEDEHHLHELRRLEAEAEQEDPTTPAEVLLPETGHEGQRHQPQRGYDHDRDDRPQERQRNMVGDQRNSGAKDDPDRLAPNEPERIPVELLGPVVRSGKERREPEPDQQE